MVTWIIHLLGGNKIERFYLFVSNWKRFLDHWHMLACVDCVYRQVLDAFQVFIIVKYDLVFGLTCDLLLFSCIYFHRDSVVCWPLNGMKAKWN